MINQRMNYQIEDYNQSAEGTGNIQNVFSGMQLVGAANTTKSDLLYEGTDDFQINHLHQEISFLKQKLDEKCKEVDSFKSTTLVNDADLKDIIHIEDTTAACPFKLFEYQQTTTQGSLGNQTQLLEQKLETKNEQIAKMLRQK